MFNNRPVLDIILALHLNVDVAKIDILTEFNENLMQILRQLANRATISRNTKVALKTSMVISPLEESHYNIAGIFENRIDKHGDNRASYHRASPLS